MRGTKASQFLPGHHFHYPPVGLLWGSSRVYYCDSLAVPLCDCQIGVVHALEEFTALLLEAVLVGLGSGFSSPLVAAAGSIHAGLGI